MATSGSRLQMCTPSGASPPRAVSPTSPCQRAVGLLLAVGLTTARAGRMAFSGGPEQRTESGAPPPRAASLSAGLGPCVATDGCEPLGITTGPDGNLWFTEELAGEIGRITTS